MTSLRSVVEWAGRDAWRLCLCCAVVAAILGGTITHGFLQAVGAGFFAGFICMSLYLLHQAYQDWRTTQEDPERER
jgi:hypothetical protein